MLGAREIMVNTMDTLLTFIKLQSIRTTNTGTTGLPLTPKNMAGIPRVGFKLQAVHAILITYLLLRV